MNALTAALKEELNVEMISLGGLQVPESVVGSWGIMLFLVIVSILLTYTHQNNSLFKIF